MNQEELWAEQIRETRLRLIARVERATSMRSPSLRTALYQQWRKELGDDTARESAKFSEAVIAGRRRVEELKRMVD